MKTVVGFLYDYKKAENLVDSLVNEGINRSSIDIVRRGPEAKGREEVSFLQKLKMKLGMDVPAEHHDYYAEGIRRGGVIVSADVTDTQVDRVVYIMNDHGAVDIEQRAAQWKKSGWAGFDEKAAAYTPRETEKERETVLPVSEETVKIGKRTVTTGGVRVYTRVVEKPVEQDVHLREEHAKVSRRSVDRPLRAGEEAFKETSIDITESAEEPVISKEARVKEEVVVGKEASERTERITETARRTEVSVEDTEDFRTHFKSNYASLGAGYESYDPAYRYAETMSADKRYSGKDWAVIENDVRADWERKNPGTWDKFKGAIHYGWNRMKGKSARKAA